VTPTRPSLHRPFGALTGAVLILAGLFPAATAVLAVSTTLVINEIDYDQPSIDTAEFLEIKNVGASAVDLDPYAVVLLNGATAGTAYLTIDLPAVVLASGEYYVICGNAANTANCDLDVEPDSNLIQNGAPDAVAIRLGDTTIDAVSYEGDTTGATEGSGAGLEDTALEVESISRCPDGTDTDQNNVDFQLRPITPGTTNDCPIGDAAPTVTSTSPLDGATGVATNAEISFTFSEPAAIADNGATVECNGADKESTLGGGPMTFTLTTLPFVDGDDCTVTILALAVTDADMDDPPDNMAADFTFSFSFGVPAACDDPFSAIYDIQGDGPVAAMTGPVTTQGVVIGDFEGPSPTLRGFYLQDPIGDADASTSDGLFVFNGSNDSVALGDEVRVSGTAQEFQDQTQIGSVTSVAVCSSGNDITPTDVTFPVEAVADLEAYEGMLVRLPQTLTVTEHFQLARFGQVTLSSGGRLFQGTHVAEPGDDAVAVAADNLLRRIIVDDALQNQNADPILFARGGNPLSAANTLRTGDTATNIVGVMTYTWAGNAASGNAYRVRPINALGGGVPDFQPANPRPNVPDDVGGNLKVAAFNVLNYFDTLDLGPDICGPAMNQECRGADSAFEFTRQHDKIVAAMVGMDADIVGLMEIENDAGDAVQSLVDGINLALGGPVYDYVDTGTIGDDAIKLAMIYKSAVVEPVNGHAILDSTVDPMFDDTLNRPALAQTFELVDGGARLTVVVNHLKSKGSSCEEFDDPDLFDGQGNCNLTRTHAATALVNWLANDPTGIGDRDVLVIGDLNSYAKEDPIRVFEGAGYSNLIDSFIGPDAYSFVFDAASGYLDHALASPTLAAQVVGVTEWHVNADEPVALDYNDNFKSAGQLTSLYAADPFRSSDHDPVIVGLDLLNLGVEFGPFAPPVADPPETSVAKAGSVVSVRFGLDGDDDLGSFFGQPQAYRCGMPGADRMAAQTAGASGFRFDAAADRYVFAWKSMTAWADSCRTIEFVLDDGTYRTASVMFRK
jgi:hypothetical protein